MQSYELVLVLVPTLEDEALQAQVDVVTGRITQLGGTVDKTEVWGRKQLAYPIKKYHEGHFILFNMQVPPTAVVSLERDLKISEPVLRHLVVRANE